MLVILLSVPGYTSVTRTRVRRVQKKSSRQATLGWARRDSRSLSWKALVLVLFLRGRNLAAKPSPVLLWTTRFTTPNAPLGSRGDAMGEGGGGGRCWDSPVFNDNREHHGGGRRGAGSPSHFLVDVVDGEQLPPPAQLRLPLLHLQRSYGEDVRSAMRSS